MPERYRLFPTTELIAAAHRHLRQLAPHVKQREGNRLLRQLVDRVERLQAVMYEAAGRCESAAQEHGCEDCRKIGTILHEAAEGKEGES